MQGTGAVAFEALEKFAGLIESGKGTRRTDTEKQAIKLAVIDACEAVRDLGPGVEGIEGDQAIGYAEAWKSDVMDGRFFKINPKLVHSIARRCLKMDD